MRGHVLSYLSSLDPSGPHASASAPLASVSICARHANACMSDFVRNTHKPSQVKWLYTKYVAGEGAVLGDDMGLGKTVQSIALVSAVLRKTGETPALLSPF